MNFICRHNAAAYTGSLCIHYMQRTCIFKLKIVMFVDFLFFFLSLSSLFGSTWNSNYHRHTYTQWINLIHMTSSMEKAREYFQTNERMKKNEFVILILAHYTMWIFNLINLAIILLEKRRECKWKSQLASQKASKMCTKWSQFLLHSLVYSSVSVCVCVWLFRLLPRTTNGRILAQNNL